MIYTGMGQVPDQITLKKHFYTNKRCGADLKVKVITAESKDIIGQYIIFCHVLDEQVRIHGRTRKAVEETIRICRKRKVLTEYLKEREKEVISIMITLFDQKYAVEQYGKVQKKKGREEGKIIEFISIRKEDGWKKKDIIINVVDRFGVDKKDAERYYKKVCG